MSLDFREALEEEREDEIVRYGRSVGACDDQLREILECHYTATVGGKWTSDGSEMLAWDWFALDGFRIERYFAFLQKRTIAALMSRLSGDNLAGLVRGVVELSELFLEDP